MSLEDFKSCARHTLGDVVDSWTEEVVHPLVSLGRWFKQQDETIRWIFSGVAGRAASAAIAWVAEIVGAAASEVVVAAVGAFAAGVGVGSGLIVVAECGEHL
jgi:Zn-dependent protease with chaperone function